MQEVEILVDHLNVRHFLDVLKSTGVGGSHDDKDTYGVFVNIASDQVIVQQKVCLRNSNNTGLHVEIAGKLLQSHLAARGHQDVGMVRILALGFAPGLPVLLHSQSSEHDSLGRPRARCAQSSVLDVHGSVPQVGQNRNTPLLDINQHRVLVVIGQILGEVLHDELLGVLLKMGVDEGGQVQLRVAVKTQSVVQNVAVAQLLGLVLDRSHGWERIRGLCVARTQGADRGHRGSGRWRGVWRWRLVRNRVCSARNSRVSSALDRGTFTVLQSVLCSNSSQHGSTKHNRSVDVSWNHDWKTRAVGKQSHQESVTALASTHENGINLVAGSLHLLDDVSCLLTNELARSKILHSKGVQGNVHALANNRGPHCRVGNWRSIAVEIAVKEQVLGQRNNRPLLGGLLEHLQSRVEVIKSGSSRSLRCNTQFSIGRMGGQNVCQKRTCAGLASFGQPETLGHHVSIWTPNSFHKDRLVVQTDMAGGRTSHGSQSSGGLGHTPKVLVLLNKIWNWGLGLGSNRTNPAGVGVNDTRSDVAVGCQSQCLCCGLGQTSNGFSCRQVLAVDAWSTAQSSEIVLHQFWQINLVQEIGRPTVSIGDSLRDETLFTNSAAERSGFGAGCFVSEEIGQIVELALVEQRLSVGVLWQMVLEPLHLWQLHLNGHFATNVLQALVVGGVDLVHLGLCSVVHPQDDVLEVVVEIRTHSHWLVEKTVWEENWGQQRPDVQSVAHPGAGDLHSEVEVRSSDRHKRSWALIHVNVDCEQRSYVLRSQEEDPVEQHVVVFDAGLFFAEIVFGVLEREQQVQRDGERVEAASGAREVSQSREHDERRQFQHPVPVLDGCARVGGRPHSNQQSSKNKMHHSKREGDPLHVREPNTAVFFAILVAVLEQPPRPLLHEGRQRVALADPGQNRHQ
ncbi:hypothetical protein OGAPHI_006498 [Ogataea philodendri]|uniref:Uncharacterized protein n=1 Tax=Ogataea philodendri TaxID=1378263 RepID=A0A9P8NXD3_9ASCO|nr:uncharacterized protein OGAPHI_006498 [Ogataea philodendri]KAH3661648.1 hypothetical protein OGAPHI_006498 [Ogataea philodendri]